jgi:NAD-dependent deacetylase
MEAQINKIAELIVASKRIVVFTGAGISTESGIPDFRGPQGLWTKVDPDDFTIDKFLCSEETRRRMWQNLREGGLMSDVQPNRAHYAVAELEKFGKLSSVITQNVDNLHQKAGNSPHLVYELHGNLQRIVCMQCHKRYPIDIVKEHTLSSGCTLSCASCNGLLKPDVVLFGEMLPQDVLARATQEANNCDFLMVIGSTLFVYPAAYLPLYAKRAGAKIAIINMGETQQDNIADVRIDAPAGEVMSKILERLKAISM